MADPGPGDDARPAAGVGVSTARLWPRTHPNHLDAQHTAHRPSPGPRHAAAEHTRAPSAFAATAASAPATWTPQHWQPPTSTAYGYPATTAPPVLGYAPMPYTGSATGRSYHRLVKVGAAATMLAVIVALAAISDRPFNSYRAGQAIGTLLIICLGIWLIRRVFLGPKHRRRAGVMDTQASVRSLVIWVSALVLLTGVGVLDYIRLTPTDRTVALPDSFGSYTKTSDARFTQWINAERKNLPSGTSNAPVALYAPPGSSPALIVVALYSDLSSDVANELERNSPDLEARGFLAGAGVSATGQKSYAPGPLGGALDCGTGYLDAAPFIACAWADSSTTALVLDASPQADIDQVAAVTLQLRAAAEQSR